MGAKNIVDDIAQGLRVQGFKAAGISCGIKRGGKKDLALILSDVDADVAGVFTKNSVKAAPVLVDIERVRKGKARGVVINSGNANACTGPRGYKDAMSMAGCVEEAAGVKNGAILVCSTGVIGVPLPVERVRQAAPALIGALGYNGLGGACEAIMTTDAFPKKAFARTRIGGKTVAVAGIAKGAGMICPNMATMLAFFVTDADIRGRALKLALREAVDGSFNSIIVDNDTSTNDTVLVFANGMSRCAEIKAGSREFNTFLKLLNGVALKLAKMVVRDGEGATRLMEIDLKGAASASDAGRGARTIAESFLVKTAFFGADPNWGRIMAALGRSGIRFKEERVDISFNGVKVVRGGLDTGREKEAADAIRTDEVRVTVDLRAGKHDAKVWTSDLTYEYVKINSAYRT
ncbi:MAG: bifunctional glutamate N-acetyltransferase/amino-acid acetyltransferase ArgJ [Deltaproteobacteria bacterium]|nr:bifunctional glutamate N-acetyltransferase/amino-acid acetyltransferase ArgJ [Deltaproteobacteria bacterium]